MVLSDNPAEVLAFVTQHNPSKSRVFALVRNSEHGSGYVRLEAVATSANLTAPTSFVLR